MQNQMLNQNPGQLLRLADVLKILSISKAYHFALLNKNSKSYDPTYPKPISIGARSVRYSEGEVLAWIQTKKEEGRNETC